MSLCVQTTEEVPIYFTGTKVSRCSTAASCMRTVGIDLKTRLGNSTAEGCGRWTDPETPGVTYRKRTTVQVLKYYKRVYNPITGLFVDEEVATTTQTTIESREGDLIVVNGADCGEIDDSSSETPDPPDPADWDSVEPSGEPTITYEDGYTDEDVCQAAQAALDWGDWSEWAPYQVAGQDWLMDIASGATTGALPNRVLAAASIGYAVETKIRVRGAYPIVLVWTQTQSGGIYDATTREILLPGAERYFEAPSDAACALEGGFITITHTLACMGPAHLVALS